MGVVGLTMASPATADATHQAVIGMPFTGKWAYNVATAASCGSGSNQTSHPSCHMTNPSTGYLWGDWATDAYAGDGTDVKLSVPYATGTLAYVFVPVTNGSCGHRVEVTVKVGGTEVGQVYFDHLKSEVTSQAGLDAAMSSGGVIGKVDQTCHIGYSHTHIELKSTPDHACYVNYSNTNNTAGMTVNQDSNFGVLGSPNTGKQQACASVPSGNPPPTDTDGDGIPNAQDQCPTQSGPASTAGCPDLDGDGVKDSIDVAPTVPGPANNRGFPLSNRIVSGDFNGDGYGDTGDFYNYGGGRTRLWLIYGSATGLSAETMVWDSGPTPPNWWDATQMKSAVTDINHDGLSDIVAFYNYGSSTVKAWVFYGSSTGVQAPAMQWYSGAGNWDWNQVTLVAGDFNGDGYGDVGAFYYYGGGDTRLWLFPGSATGLQPEYINWSSGVGNWDATNMKTVVADVNHDGFADIVAFYNYEAAGVRAWILYGSTTGVQPLVNVWYSGAGNWWWNSVQLTAGDFNGDGYGDVGAFYDYGSGGVRLWEFNGSSSGFQPESVAWYSGAGNWGWNNVRSTAADFNHDGKVDVGAFYGYGGSETRLWVFPGASSGFQPESVGWDSHPGNWNWDCM